MPPRRKQATVTEAPSASQVALQYQAAALEAAEAKHNYDKAREDREGAVEEILACSENVPLDEDQMQRLGEAFAKKERAVRTQHEALEGARKKLKATADAYFAAKEGRAAPFPDDGAPDADEA